MYTADGMMVLDLDDLITWVQDKFIAEAREKLKEEARSNRGNGMVLEFILILFVQFVHVNISLHNKYCCVLGKRGSLGTYQSIEPLSYGFLRILIFAQENWK